ncbi:MAG: YggS family pyridoxal phosphate-dependent enzyme [Flavobacteriaceae bacterium]|jgi:PLP dependent protein|nr:YggS family pyridoxal phosphate-dependent enzyme [Flavobacteriaceae bacterium]MDG1921106.1 YggS family pyridoxal phosphate-dependent enzyme [Flavobacteriaceae bacterium]
MGIQHNITELKSSLPPEVSLVAVSKTKPVSDLLEAYQAGQRIFGENKIQEMVSKWEQLPKDIQWHMIGHVQTNKVKYMAPFVHTIHAVDRIKLLKEIQKQAEKNERIINCLIQIRIAEEDTKFGLAASELDAMLEAAASCSHVKIKGLMGMATFTSDTDQIQTEFQKLAQLYQKNSEFEVLSMGMSGDYPIAIEAGSNMIRVGSKLFGERNY